MDIRRRNRTEKDDIRRYCGGKIKMTIEEKLEQSMAGKVKKSIARALNSYFAPKSFERSGKLYEALGVKAIKKLVVFLGRRRARYRRVNFENNYFIWDHSSKGLKEFEYKTRINEAIHIIPTIIASGGTIYLLSKGDYGWAALYTTANLLFGIGPLMLQRYNRARIYNVLEKMEAKGKQNDNRNP